MIDGYGKRECLLAILKDRIDLETIQSLLSKYGLELKINYTATGREGLKTIEKDPVKIVLIEQALGDMSWQEFMEELKQREVQVPVIMITEEKAPIEELIKEEVYIWLKRLTDLEALSFFIAYVISKFEKDRKRRRKEELIIESRRQWMAIVDAITDYVYVIDNDFNIIKTNLALVNYLKKTPKEVIGKKCYEVFNCKMKNSCPKEVVTSTQKPYTYEKLKDNRTYQITVYPLYEEEEIFTVHYMKDVTEIKRLKEHLYYTDKLTALGQLVSGVAHEINNPLTGVIAYAEILLTKTTEDWIKDALKKILHSADRCKRIVDNLLTFSRQRKPMKSLESMNSIIERAIELRGYWIRKHNIEVVKKFGNIPSVFVDPQQMQEVILNILINAEQAIVYNNIENGKIVFITEYDAGRKKVIIKVIDNGPGIPEDLLQKIFEPFFTTKPVGVGTGLGLSISHSIVTEHGGEIWAENAPSGGAILTIEIPTTQEILKKSE